MKLDVTPKEILLLRLSIVNSIRNITDARDRAVERYGYESETTNKFRQELIELESLYHRLCE